jgi:hypothetical protein
VLPDGIAVPAEVPAPADGAAAACEPKMVDMIFPKMLMGRSRYDIK